MIWGNIIRNMLTMNYKYFIYANGQESTTLKI